MNIKNRIFSFALFGVLTLFGTYGAARAQDSSSGSTLGSNDWEFAIVPYLWMSGLSGDIGVRGQTADVDISFSDIWDALDFGGQVHIEAKRGNWGFFIDTTYLKLSVDQERPGV